MRKIQKYPGNGHEKKAQSVSKRKQPGLNKHMKTEGERRGEEILNFRWSVGGRINNLLFFAPKVCCTWKYSLILPWRGCAETEREGVFSFSFPAARLYARTGVLVETDSCSHVTMQKLENCSGSQVMQGIPATYYCYCIWLADALKRFKILWPTCCILTDLSAG